MRNTRAVQKRVQNLKKKNKNKNLQKVFMNDKSFCNVTLLKPNIFLLALPMKINYGSFSKFIKCYNKCLST